MKKILLISTLVGGLSSAAYADPMGISISGDYALEAEKWSSSASYSKKIAGVTITPSFDFSYLSSGNAGGLFDGASIGTSYPLGDNLSLNSKLGLTNKWKYEELTLGISFSF
jgi:hypothetical protein